MSKFYDLVEDICSRDKRYKPDAYEFVLQGLNFTQNKFKRQAPYNPKGIFTGQAPYNPKGIFTGQAHVSGRELACGLRDFAINQYGALARRVLSHWGINQTQDFGNIVFNMIEKKLLSRTKEDCLADFNAVYDFNAAFANVLADSVAEGLRVKRGKPC